MGNIKLGLILAIQMMCFCSHGQNKGKSSSDKKVDTVSIQKCITLLSDGNRFWKADSLGKAGYRALLTKEFLRKCSFTNMKWRDIRDYFGKPNTFFTRDHNVHYRFRILEYFYLDIIVNDGTIIEFRTEEADG